MVGDGQLRNSLQALAINLQIENQIVFTGNQDQVWLSQVIPRASAVLSPHTGRALSEAALGGVPIIAYDIDWQGEVIKTGLTGELVPHLDWAAMANSLERILSDSAYGQLIGNAVRQHILKMMDPQTLNQHERAEYLKLFNRF